MKTLVCKGSAAPAAAGSGGDVRPEVRRGGGAALSGTGGNDDDVDDDDDGGGGSDVGEARPLPRLARLGVSSSAAPPGAWPVLDAGTAEIMSRECAGT